MNALSGHGYITGAVLIGVGIVGMIGAFTGNLAPMIAALFAPEYLNTNSSSGPTTVVPTGPATVQAPTPTKG